MATFADNGYSCLLCGAKVNVGLGGGDDTLLINSRKEICSKFVNLVWKYLSLKFPIESNGSSGDPRCCHICLPAVTEFCDIYKRLECVQLEMIRSAEDISKLLISNYVFRDEFISSVDSKRRQHCPDFTPVDDDHDDDEKLFTDSVVDTASVDLGHDYQNPEDEEETEVKNEFLEECHEDVSNDGEGDSANFPDDYYSIEYNVGNKSNGAAVKKRAVIKRGLPKPKHCIFCNKKFRGTNALTEHMRCHTFEKPSFCHICLKEYGSKWSIARHIKLHHEKAPNKCEICGKLVADIHQHRRHKHGFGPKLVCDICGKAFISRHKLARHQPVHTRERKFECDICHLKLRYAQQVKLHKLKFHGDNNEADEGKTFHCHSCGIQFEAKWRWLQHRREEHKGKESFKCPHPSCKAVFSKHFKLKHHLVKHSQEKERPSQCDQCGASFFNNGALKVHIQKMHSLANPIKCKHCDETFTDKCELKNHEKTHLFDCDICGKIFKRLCVLKTHRDEVHLNIEKSYVCEICGETLKNHYYMSMHKLKVHERKMFECPHPSCNYASCFKKDLKRHASSHSKERPFQCDLCSERYTLKSSLTRHFKKTHLGEKK